MYWLVNIFRFVNGLSYVRASLVVQMVKNPSAMQETLVQSLGWENLLEEGMAIHSSILAWRILWTEKPGGLLSIGSHRVGHNWSDLAFMHSLKKEMATHSSILARRIPGTEEPGGLPTMGSHKVGRDWSDLAAAAREDPYLWSLQFLLTFPKTKYKMSTSFYAFLERLIL